MYALVSIGLLSFSAVAQFTPAIIGGMFWKGGTRLRAIYGRGAGFGVWVYTLLLPSFARSGGLPITFLSQGGGIDLLKPQELFGLQGLDAISHCLFWSLFVNIGLYITLSLLRRPDAAEHTQATLFVDASRQSTMSSSHFWRGSASINDLLELLGRFLGPTLAHESLTAYA